MKHIVTAPKDERILAISDTLSYNEANQPVVNDGKLAFACEVNLYEVETVPEEVEVEKFCYTKEKGFFENEDYEPPRSPEQVMLDALLAAGVLTKEQYDEAVGKLSQEG